MCFVAPIPSPAALAPVDAGELAGQALADLRDDLGELGFVARSARARVRSAAAELERVESDLQPATLAVLRDQLGSADGRLRALCGRLSRAAARSDLDDLAATKAAVADQLRAESGLVGALATAADWQSPSFLHSISPAAGRHAGRIAPHWTDYKRDRHLDAAEYERAYVEELIDGPPDVRALLTSCGMAAFTTIVGSLHMAHRLAGPLLLGHGLYHETKELLERSFPGAVCQVDERDTRALLRTIRTLRPSAVFLDTLCNTRWAPLPDVAAVLGELRDRDMVVVLDNTALSAGFQPFRLLGAAEHPRLIVFESLLKYPQLGLDRVNAGVILGRGADAEALERDREHLGTNIGDAAVQSLPPPSRRVLERRLARLGRNAELLARRLAAATSGHSAVRVFHPALAEHPEQKSARGRPFRGACVSIASTPERERRFMAGAFAEARARGVPLIGGSSFGFDVTRLYLTAARTHHGEAFVRVAAGTEDRMAVEELAGVLAAALARS